MIQRLAGGAEPPTPDARVQTTIAWAVKHLKFVGLDHETVFYDPKAFVEPLRATYRYVVRTCRTAPSDSPSSNA